MTWHLRIDDIDPSTASALESMLQAHCRQDVHLVDPTTATFHFPGPTPPPLSVVDALAVWLSGFGAPDAPLHTCAAAPPWQPGWRALFHTAALSPRICVALPGAPPGPAPAHTLYLEPGGAFGSGHHPSTRLAMALLDAVLLDRTATRVLDVGCGSGVLGLAAAALGATVTGIDIDAASVTIAARHAVANRLTDRCTWRQGGLEAATGTWPVVAANMPAGCLLDLAPGLVERCTDTLVLSGFEDRARKDMATAFSTLTLHTELTEGHWRAWRLAR